MTRLPIALVVGITLTAVSIGAPADAAQSVTPAEPVDGSQQLAEEMNVSAESESRLAMFDSARRQRHEVSGLPAPTGGGAANATTQAEPPSYLTAVGDETSAQPVFLNGIRIEVEGDGSLRVVGTAQGEKIHIGSTIDYDTFLPVPGSYWVCTWEDEDETGVLFPPAESDCLTVVGVTNNVILNGKAGDDEVYFGPVYILDLGDYLYSAVVPNDLLLFGEDGDDVLAAANGSLNDGDVGTGDDAYVYAGAGDDWIFIEQMTVGDDLFTRGQAGSDRETVYDLRVDLLSQRPGDGDAADDVNTAVVYGGYINKWIYRGGRGADGAELGARMGRNPVFSGSGGRDTVVTRTEVRYGNDVFDGFSHKGWFRFRGGAGSDLFEWMAGDASDIVWSWQCKQGQKLDLRMGAGSDTAIVQDWLNKCADYGRGYEIDSTSSVNGQTQPAGGGDELYLLRRRSSTSAFVVPNIAFEQVTVVDGD